MGNQKNIYRGSSRHRGGLDSLCRACKVQTATRRRKFGGSMRTSFLVRSVGQPVGTGRASLSTTERLSMTIMRHVMVLVEVETAVVVVRSVSVVKVVIVLLHVRRSTTLTARERWLT